MTKTIALLGSTGSIGRQTLEVTRELGLTVAALTAHTNIDLLEQQARQFRPRLAAVYDPDAARVLRERLSDMDIQVLAGEEPFPLVMDDPFLTWDNDRTARGLALLSELGKERQIVLLTCR